jgi:peptide/nickel transport system permease protein
MLGYALKRLAGLIVVLWAMSVVMFVVIRVIPGNPIAGLVGFGTPRYVIEHITQQMGLNRPLYIQYIDYVRGLLHGDLGISFESRLPVVSEMGRYFTASAELVLVSMILTVPLGMLLGIISAARWRTASDGAIRFLSLAGAAAPLFWMALVFQLVFFRYLGWLPVDGRIGVNVPPPRPVTGLFLVDSLLTLNWEAFRSSLLHILLPATVLALNSIGVLVRQTRASLLQVLSEDFIRTGRAKGLRERVVLLRHAMKNAAIPVVTEIGMQFGNVLGATFLVEIVFSWPGLGLYAVRAIVNLDYPAVMGVAQLFTLIYVLTNFLVDISYPLIDPRISR